MGSNKSYMEDSMGRLVPVEIIPEETQLRDQLVRNMISNAESMRRDLARFKGQAFDDVYTFVEMAAERYGEKWGGTQGNITLTSFDGKKRVCIDVSPLMSFDEKLQVAKQLIDECAKEWAEGSRPEVQALIQDAFQVDAAGKISTWRVWSLRRLKIEDERWQKAMKMIGESVEVVGKQEYIRFYTREKRNGRWDRVPLDLATA
jgi:hypothetical protein